MSFHTVFVKGDGAKVGIQHGLLYAIDARIQMGLNSLIIMADPKLNGKKAQVFFNQQHMLHILDVHGKSSVRVETGAVLAPHFSVRSKKGNVSVEQSPDHMLQVYANKSVIWLRKPVLSATIVATKHSAILGELIIQQLSIHLSEKSDAKITVMRNAKVSKTERDESQIEIKYQI